MSLKKKLNKKKMTSVAKPERTNKYNLNTPIVKVYMAWKATPKRLRPEGQRTEEEFAKLKGYNARESFSRYSQIEGYFEELKRLQDKYKSYYTFNANKNLSKIADGCKVKTTTIEKDERGNVITSITEQELPPNVKANELLLKLYGGFVDKIELVQNKLILDAAAALDDEDKAKQNETGKK